MSTTELDNKTLNLIVQYLKEFDSIIQSYIDSNSIFYAPISKEDFADLKCICELISCLDNHDDFIKSIYKIENYYNQGKVIFKSNKPLLN